MGKKLAQLFESKAVDTTKHYKEACAWYGALDVAGLTKDQSLVDDLIKRYEPLEGSYGALLSGQGHVDQNVFGIVPLEIYLQNSDESMLEEGLSIADHQQSNIDVQIRYAIDDMFMITGLQVQAYRASKQAKYRDLAASTMVKYLGRLQEEDGLFNHHENVLIKWGRGNGWVASGMTELMREMVPSNEGDYPKIRDGYLKMMKGLLDYQIKSGEGAGIWKQVVDNNDKANWPETSGSAMFTLAMVTGVRKGWLDCATYGPAARKAWIALVGYLDDSGQLKNISDWMWDGDLSKYLGREKVTGDNHGQAPMMWTAAALLR